MTTAPEAMPCPFCGHEKISEGYSADYRVMVCDACYAEGPNCRTFQDALTAWNMRSPAANPDDKDRRQKESGK